jgi:hypothetical protein
LLDDEQPRLAVTEIQQPTMRRSLSKLVSDSLHAVLLLKPAAVETENQNATDDNPFARDIKALGRCIVECVTRVQLGGSDSSAEDDELWRQVHEQLSGEARQLVDMMQGKLVVDMAYVVRTLGRFAVHDPLETSASRLRSKRSSSQGISRASSTDSNGRGVDSANALDQLCKLLSQQDSDLASKLVSRLEDLPTQFEQPPDQQAATKASIDTIVASALSVVNGHNAGPAVRKARALVSLHRQLDKIMDDMGWTRSAVHDWRN